MLERDALTGDWFGARTGLSDRGLVFDLAATWVVQGNATGGIDNGATSFARFDLGLTFDTQSAGLWGGGTVVFEAQGRAGAGQNDRTGTASLVDYAGAFPVSDGDTMQIADLYYEHAITEWLAVSVGRFSLRDSNVFAHDETEQFLNSALNYNLVQGTTVPSVTLGAAVYLDPADWVSISTYVLDSEGVADESGFDTAFQRGTSVLQEFEFGVDIGGRPGHQRIGWTWSDAQRVRFSQHSRDIADAILTGDTGGLETASSDWSVYYDFDQYLVVTGEDRGFGVFGRIGFGDADVNPISLFASLGIGGRGVGASRPDDSFGVGMYYAHLSDELPEAIDDRVRDEVGVEAYYSVAVTPWMLISPDVQVIGAALRDADTVVVVGVRVKVVF
jgi:porin